MVNFLRLSMIPPRQRMNAALRGLGVGSSAPLCRQLAGFAGPAVATMEGPTVASISEEQAQLDARRAGRPALADRGGAPVVASMGAPREAAGTRQADREAADANRKARQAALEAEQAAFNAKSKQAAREIAEAGRKARQAALEAEQGRADRVAAREKLSASIVAARRAAVAEPVKEPVAEPVKEPVAEPREQYSHDRDSGREDYVSPSAVEDGGGSSAIEDGGGSSATSSQSRAVVASDAGDDAGGIVASAKKALDSMSTPTKWGLGLLLGAIAYKVLTSKGKK